MLPTLHPLEKTATELRRSIARLHNYLDSRPKDASRAEIESILTALQNARLQIPQQWRDTDVRN